MKKRKSFTIGLLALGLTFTACDDDDDDTDPVLGPRLEMVELAEGSDSEGVDITITQGESVQFAWDARKGADYI
jgi:hypothetical protein